MADATPQGLMNYAYTQANNSSAQASAYAERLAQLATVEFIVDMPTTDLAALDASITNLLGMINTISPILISDDIKKNITAPGNDIINPITGITVSDFTDTVPALNYPTAPTLTTPDVPTKPILNAVTVPDKPSLTMPKAPDIAGLSFPDNPGFEFEGFTASAPTDNVGEPTNLFYYNEAEFQSLLQNPVITALINDIAGGLVPDEALDYNLAISRIDNETQKALAETRRTFTQSGFSMPTGAMIAAMQASLLNSNNQKITAVSDHALKISGLKIDNRKAALDKSIQYEDILRKFFGSLWERTLNAAKYLNDAGIAVYNARIEHFKQKLAAYTTDLQVYSEKIKALSVKAEIYKAEISVVQVQSEVQKTQVAVYQAQLSAVESQIKIYQTTMEAAKIGVEINAEIVKSFGIEVEAYKSVISANQLQIEEYKAATSAENLKLEPYKAGVEGYKAGIEGKRVTADIAKTNLNATIEAGKLKIEKYNADIQQYKADIEHAMTYLQRQIEKHGGDIQAYNTQGYLAERAYNLQYQIKKANADLNVSSSELQIKKADLELRQQMNNYELQLKANSEIAGIYKSMVSATLSVLNMITSLEQQVP
ncbi:MAG: hypothetical protein HQK98_06545 [Nitrospirae bacterium]|nr:hypothetical protein [Nitrospirota bacterium]